MKGGLRRLAQALIIALAGYGLLWLATVDDVLDVLCYGQLGTVQYDALREERAGRWLDAAHRYDYLLEYGRGSRKGSCSAEWHEGGRQLPLVAIVMRFSKVLPETTALKEFVTRDTQERYLNALRQAGVPASERAAPTR